THTSVPFLHWNDRLFDKWLWARKPKWRAKTNLWLLSAADVRELMRRSTAIDYTFQYNRVLLWPMTMTVVASRVGKVPSRAARSRSERPAAASAEAVPAARAAHGDSAVAAGR